MRTQSPASGVGETPQRAPSQWSNLPVSAWAGLAYVAVTPLENLTLPFASPVQLLGLIFLGTWVLDLLNGQTRFKTPISSLVPFVLFAAWSALTLLWSWDPDATTLRAVTNLALVLALIALADTFRGKVRLPLVAVSLAASATSVYVLLFGVYEEGLQAQIEGVDQNITAFCISIGLAAAVYLVVTAAESTPRIVWLCCVLFDVAALLRIGSRTGLVSVVGILLVLLVFGLKSSRSFIIAVTAICIGYVLFLGLLDVGLIPPRILAFIDDPVVIDGRAEITETFLSYFDLWRFVGVGGGADATFLNVVAGWPRNVHNGFWGIWVQYGIVGVLLWGWMLLIVIVGMLRLPEARFFALASVPFLAFVYTLGPMRSNLLWVVFALALTGYSTAAANLTEESLS